MCTARDNANTVTSATESFSMLNRFQCNSAADSFAMNRCLCIPKREVDTCLVEEYLTSSHCYLPSMCCYKVLENRLDIMTFLHSGMHDPS